MNREGGMNGAGRTAREVFTSHLELRAAGKLDEDLELNYHPKIVVMTARTVLRGHDGMRESAHRLWRAVSDEGDYVYETVICEDRLAFLEWRAKNDRFQVFSGVDSYLIEDGLICGQSIHYRVEDLELGVSAATISADGEQGPSSERDPHRIPELVGEQG